MAKLTIGLPIYNGGALLARSLDNLLAQSFTDFVLRISDNASTDATPDICADYARRDRRIVYKRRETNIVWNENFRSVLEPAETPYFMWATHDDIWFPRFAEANIAELDAHPEAVCSVSKIVYFTRDGARKPAPDTGPLTGTAAERLKRYLLTLDNCGRLYGVYRTAALKQSFPPHMALYASDWLVVGLTLLHGEHREVGEVLLEREAQPAGHYLKGFGKVDRFAPDWRDRLHPMRQWIREFKTHVPPDVYRAVRPALAYLSLRQAIAMAEYRLPWLAGLVRPARTLAAKLLHRRWRARNSAPHGEEAKS